MLYLCVSTEKQTMKNLILTFVAVAILGLDISYSQTTIGDVQFPTTFKAGTTTLQLNGGGIRKKLFLDVYVEGLYLQSHSKDGSAISKANEPQSVRIVITSSLVNSKNFIESTKEGFQKSTAGNTKPIQEKIDKFLNLFLKYAIAKGDVYDLTFLPMEGVKVYRNHQYVDVIPGLDFKAALFGIWLGPNPVDTKLKAGLLGQ